MNALEQRHLESLDRLRGQESLDVVDEDVSGTGSPFGELLPLTDFEDTWRDVTLDDDMLQDTTRFEELSVYWESEEAQGFFGEYRLPNPHEILSQGSQPTDDGADTERAFLQQIRYIDHAWASGSGWTTWIRMAPGSSPLEIWHHDLAMIGGEPYPKGYVKLDLTYRQYVETLLLTRGARGWQYLFTDLPFRDSPIEEFTESVIRALTVFPSWFPEHDYSDLQRRLEERL